MKHPDRFVGSRGLAVVFVCLSSCVFGWGVFGPRVAAFPGGQVGGPGNPGGGGGGDDGLAVNDPSSGQYGAPPAAGTSSLLTRGALHDAMAAHVSITAFCANGQHQVACCVAGGEYSLASSKANPLCQIGANSNGGGGGPTGPTPIVDLSGGVTRPGGSGAGWAPSGSLVNNEAYHHHHVAYDNFLPASGGGGGSGGSCPTCSGSSIPGKPGGGGAGGGGGGSCPSCAGSGKQIPIPGGSGGGSGPPVSMPRQHRGRDMDEQSSFGPGWFSGFDMKLHLNSDVIGDIDTFDPADISPRRFENTYTQQAWDEQLQQWTYQTIANDGADGVWTHETHGVIQQLVLVDGSGVPTGTRASAAKAIVTNWDGIQFEFGVFRSEEVPGTGSGGGGGSNCGDEPQESNYSTWEDYQMAWDAWYMCSYYSGGGGGGGGGTADNDVYEARLTKVTDRDGKSLTLTYKTWTAAEIAASPERQWQIDTVTDARDQTVSFSYGTQQVGGRWAVSEIQLPGGQSVQYAYANDQLSSVTRSDGSVSTFSVGYDPAIQHVTMQFNDPAADSGNRDKEVWLTSNFVEIAGSDGVPTGYFNQSSQLVRAIINPDDSVGYMQMTGDVMKGELWTYEGGGSVKRTWHTLEARYATGWQFGVHATDGTLGIAATFEDTYATAMNTRGEWKSGMPEAVLESTGVRRDFEYDPSGFVNRIVYGDQTFETAQYNSLHQVTRHRDRSGRVTRNTYDAAGHLLTREVGIQEQETPGANPGDPSTFADVNQPEHAVSQWEYYAPNHANAGLLKSEFDPQWDGSSTEMHRTDYEYNGYGQLTKILGSAGAGGQIRPETNYSYDTLKRLSSVSDPEGHTTTYTYDSLNRQVRTTYDDGSTDETLYAAAGSADEKLVIKTKDRRNVVTAYSYDSGGRPTQVVMASAIDGNILDGNADDSPITDRNQKSITTYEYAVGTDNPVRVTRDGAITDLEYDYRQRVVAVTVSPYAGKSLTTTKHYLDNRLFAEEDPYGRPTFHGYRASDGAQIRIVKAAYPADQSSGGLMGSTSGFWVGGNLAILGLSRDTDLNPQYTIRDRITDSNGNLWQVVDERGTITETEFDSRGNAIRQVAAVGTAVEAVTETVYDLAGRVTEIRSPRYFDSNDVNGYQKSRTVMTYDGAGRVSSRTDAPGTAEAGTESYTYDVEGRQLTRTDARGKVWTTHYASCCGHSVSSTNPLGHGSITNQNNGGLVTHTAGIADVATHSSLLNPEDAKTLQETTTRYDAMGRSTASTVWLVARGLVDANSPPIAGFDGVAGTDGLTTQTLYDMDLTDNAGLETSGGITVTNPQGGTYTVSLSAAVAKLGEPTAQGGAGISFAAGAPGSAVVSLNAENEVSFSISDAQGRSLMSGIVAKASGSGTASELRTWSCNVPDTVVAAAGLPTEPLVLESISVDALGNTSKSRSNGLGQTVQSVDQAGNVSTAQYDAGGNAVVSRDPNNVGQDCVYDQLGRRTSCTDTVGSVTSSGYDKAGQQVTATDAKGKVTHHAFDARGRRWKETDRLTYPTEWSYDAAGNLLTLKDAENQITSYGYNDAGQRTTEQYPDHVTGATIGQAGYGIITFSYDALGRRITKQDQQGDLTSYNFDMSGRMLTRGYVGHASGPLTGQTNTDTFTYDRSGRMLSGVKGRYNNTITFSYDDRGQQVQETLTTHGQTYTVGYVKNSLGQTSQLQYPDGSLVDRAYTNRGQLLSVEYTPNGGTASDVADFVYDAGGRETQRNLGNGLVTTRGYFADNQIQTIATPTVETLTYTYDGNKNPTSEARSGVMAPYSWTTGPTGYDDEDRLVVWTRTNGDSQSWNLSPVHDWNSTVINGATQTRTHGPAHEILTMAGAGVSPTPATLVHDTKGNMTTDDRGTDMAWDFDNMLQTFTANGVTDLSNATYEYDVIGRRTAKNVAQSGGGTATTLFVQAGQQVTCEYTPGNATTDSDRKYAYGTYIDEALNFVDATSANEVRYWLHQNQQYSVYALTSNTGNTVELYSYSTHGLQGCHDVSGSYQGTSPMADNTVLYTGRQFDAESDVLHFRSRHIRPQLGTFLSRDTIGYFGGENLIAIQFALKGIDPSGKSWCWSCEGTGVNEGKVCGYDIWLLTGNWCEWPDVVLAAIDGHEDYMNCWWKCEKQVHSTVCGKLLVATEVVSGTLAVPAVRLLKPEGARQVKDYTTIARTIGRAVGGESSKAAGIGKTLGRSVVTIGGKVVFVGTIVVEAGVAWYCAGECW